MDKALVQSLVPQTERGRKGGREHGKKEKDNIAY
jgi:hypothetical protein